MPPQYSWELLNYNELDGFDVAQNEKEKLSEYSVVVPIKRHNLKRSRLMCNEQIM